MRCAKCGFSNIHGAKFCSECGSPLQMPGADRPNRSANRKVIKLPSDMSNEPTTPIERPWEVRVPKRDGATPTTPGSASAPGAAASSDKTPTPRRRASAAATTGKIPVIKRPTSESGRVPDEDRAATRTARTTTTSTGARSAASATTPILIDDFAAEPAPTRSAGTTGDIPGSRTRRSVRHDTTRTTRNTTGDRKRFVIILIALLVICCLVAFGVFLANSGSKSKTVSFDTDGGTVIGNQYILENGKLERPANPTRPGYTFDGWYLDANYNEEASFPIDVTQDMTLYAKWKQESSSSALPALSQRLRRARQRLAPTPPHPVPRPVTRRAPARVRPARHRREAIPVVREAAPALPFPAARAAPARAAAPEAAPVARAAVPRVAALRVVATPVATT